MAPNWVAKLKLALIDVDGNDARGFGHGRADDDREADAAQSKDGDGVALLHLGRILHRAHAGGDATAQQADLLQIGRRVDLGQRDLGQNRILTESGGAHVVIDGLAVLVEARRSVGHQALALGSADLLAEVGLTGEAELALATFGRVERNHMVADRHRGDPFAHLLDDAAAFMAEDAGEDAFGVGPGERVGVGVADARGDDPHQDLARLRRHDVHLLDLQGLIGGPGNGGA